MSRWRVEPALAEVFGDLDAVFALQGERITSDPLSEVLRVEHQGLRYYVKRYWGGGKGLRRYLGRPRVKAEWQNLKHFASWGIPTAPVVAYGMERRGGAFVRGALITGELVGTEDLAALANRNDPRLRDRHWVDRVSRQLARATRIMHRHHFAHNDLKWRNLLVTQAGAVLHRLSDRRLLVRSAAALPDHQGPGLSGQGGPVPAQPNPAAALLPAIP